MLRSSGITLVQCVFSILFLLGYRDGSASNVVNKKPKCGGGDPCIFIGKDQWIGYEEETGPKPYPPKTDSWKKNDSTIFLAIASFRDKLCPKTLFNLYTKAAHPDRVHVGVVQQNIAGEDIECFEEYCKLMGSDPTTGKSCPYANNIKINKQDAKVAEGPTWARALGSKMVGDQEFCMQTDSHMDFVPEWDKKMLEMWAMTNNEYGVLSTYVADSVQLQYNLNGGKGLNGLHEVPHLCMVTFHGAYGMVRNWGTKCARNLPRPKLTNIVWGAGLSFSKCHAERKVPYDPHTPGIFDGEEYSRGLRLWTYGYDTYTPHRVFVVHNYVVSQSDPKHSAWAMNGMHVDVDSSVKRLRTIFGMPDGYTFDQQEAIIRGKYGRGDRRTLDQAIAFSGIDTKNLKHLFNGCGNVLQWVPFKEHPLGPDHIPKFDPETEAPLDEPDPGSIYYKAGKELPKPEQVTDSIDSSSVVVAGAQSGEISHHDGERIDGGSVGSAAVQVQPKAVDSKQHSEQLSIRTGTGSYAFRSRVKQKILDEYAMLLEVESEAQAGLDRTGHPGLVLFLVFFVVCLFCWIGGHRCHVGKNHQLADWFESVKTV